MPGRLSRKQETFADHLLPAQMSQPANDLDTAITGHHILLSPGQFILLFHLDRPQ